jgi:hypothetical protein
MKNVSQLVAAAVLALCAGTVHAQVGNTCTGAVDSPFQGGHQSSTDVSGTPVNGALWPPNHNFRTVKISAENSQEHPCNVTISDVRQDEPVQGTGSGSTTPDAKGCSNAGDVSQVELRGERAGNGTGRFYTITYTMDDPDFPVQKKNGVATVLVPHDQGMPHLNTYINEGPAFESADTTAPISCSN